MIAKEQDLTREDYDLIRKLVYAKSGINLGDGKLKLVRSRLGKRVQQEGFKSFREYYRHVERDPTGEELCILLDAISTNTTHLFRESRHFDFMRNQINRWLDDEAWRSQHSTLRIWSAACSSGEEPYSIAMVVHDMLRNHPGIEIKILATDLSTQVLSKAKLGLYDADSVETVPSKLRQRYLQKVRQDGGKSLQVVPELRRMVTFARFNLMTETFPFRHGFHIIFCRNVMIYFDRPTQETLVNKLAHQLHEDGYLMIGHSESLSGVKNPLAYAAPATYWKGKGK